MNLRKRIISALKYQELSYLTSWKLIGNSETHGKGFWNCGEYSEVDGKYHIFIKPLDREIIEVILDEPLMKIDEMADTLEYDRASDTITLVKRLNCELLPNDPKDWKVSVEKDDQFIYYRYPDYWSIKYPLSKYDKGIFKIPGLTTYSSEDFWTKVNDSYLEGVTLNSTLCFIRKDGFANDGVIQQEFFDFIQDRHIIYELNEYRYSHPTVHKIKKSTEYSQNLLPGSESIQWTNFITPVPGYLNRWSIKGNTAQYPFEYPGGYKLCKYIESDGFCYMDLGIRVDAVTEILISASPIGDSGVVSGAINSNEEGIMVGYTPTTLYGCLSDQKASTDLTFDLTSNNKYVIGLDGYSAYVALMDGTKEPPDLYAEFEQEEPTIKENNLNIFLFGLNQNGSLNRQFRGRIYSAYLYEDLELKFGGRPCLDSNNVPCLYDIVSQTAFYNLGSGNLNYELESNGRKTFVGCGEYSNVDGKYHIKIKPEGKPLSDIALDRPIYKAGSVYDYIKVYNEDNVNYAEVHYVTDIVQLKKLNTKVDYNHQLNIDLSYSANVVPNVICDVVKTVSYSYYKNHREEKCLYIQGKRSNEGWINLNFNDYHETRDEVVKYDKYTIIGKALESKVFRVPIVPIEESSSYSMIRSPDSKSPEWSEFIPDTNN